MAVITCAWCDKPSTVEVEVESPIYHFEAATTPGGKRRKVMTRRAITAHVCPAHAEMVHRNRAEAAARKAKAAAERKAKRAA